MNYKKVISMGIALSLVLGSNDYTLAVTEELLNSSYESDSENSFLKQQLGQATYKNLSNSDEVRVIVELDEKPTIEKATEKGIRLKDMDETEVEKLQEKICDEQASVQDDMESTGIEYQVINQFENVINGFSVKTTLENAKDMEKIKGVKSVSLATEYARPEPDMIGSGEITEAPKAWDLGYKGEGTVVAIIDSGIDPSHHDMILTDESTAKLTKNNIDNIIKDNNLPGEYKTTKVPYGYNYMDNNSEILDIGPATLQHGMHVAGIVGANGNYEKGGIKGTAPESQLLAMKVFGNDPTGTSTFGDVIVKAIDDSVILGADVASLSLGNPGSFQDDNTPEQIAVKRAVENGVVMSFSAGNSAVFGNRSIQPFAKNPDYGVINSPGSSPYAIQVASLQNTRHTYPLMDIVSGEYKKSFPYTCNNIDSDPIIDLKDESLMAIPYEVAKESNDFQGSINGKIVLIDNTDDYLTDILLNLQQCNASAIMVNTSSYDSIYFNKSIISIPILSISKDTKNYIIENYKEDNFAISFGHNHDYIDNYSSGEMSDFSSWGVTPNLDLKPDITGIGGNIWSTSQNNNYQNMTGTSMATPNVSGGCALMIQRLNKLFNLSGQEKVIMAKNLLMSTSVPNKYGDIYNSPRNQGSGVMNLLAATSSNAIITDNDTGLCKVNLKEIKNNSASFTMNIENFGDKDITYNIDGTVQSDNTEFNDENVLSTTLTPQKVLDKNTQNMPITFNKNKVKVPAGGSTSVVATINLTNAVLESGKTIEETFKNGMFVEGFVFLNATNNEPNLSIPYMGFKGDWAKAPIIDNSIYENFKESFYKLTAMTSKTSDDRYLYAGIVYNIEDNYTNDKIDFSPNGDGYFDYIFPQVSFLRSAKEVQFEILDENEKPLRTLDKMNNVIKNFSDYPMDYGSFYELENAAWDGTIDGNLVADGTYIYRIKAKIDYEGADWQNYDFKINIDNIPPKINNFKYDKDEKTLTISAEDNLEGHIKLYILDGPDLETPITSTTGVIDVSPLEESGHNYKEYTLTVLDYAGNKCVVNLSEPTEAKFGDKKPPRVFLETPDNLAELNVNHVLFEGTVKDESAIDSVTINGENLNLKYDPKENVWNFNQVMILEEGYNEVYVNSKDVAGNEVGFNRIILVDTMAPTMDLENIPEVTTKDTVNIKGHVKDNLPNVTVKVNDNIAHKIAPEWSYFSHLKPASCDINYDYKLKNGDNKIVVSAEDKMGNTTTHEFVVKKVDNMNTDVIKLAGENRFETAVKVSETGFGQSDYAILANGTAYVDSLVAAPLASTYKAPILLTEKNQLTEITAEELDRLGVKKVFLVGGTTVISNDVANNLTSLGIEVMRLGGEDRYDTSLLIAKYLNRQNSVDTVYIASGNAIADAVTISSKAAIEKNPIILVKENEITKNTLTWITNKNLANAYIIGGTNVIKDSVVGELDNAIESDISKNRIAGKDRYATNAAVMDTFFSSVLENVMVTESLKLVDALVVAPYAAKTNSPIVISSDELSEEQKYIMDKTIASHITQVGGEVNEKVIKDMQSRLSIEQ